MEIKTCAHCGKEFSKETHLGQPKKYCSKKCKDKACRQRLKERAKQAKEPRYGICLYCGCVFERTGSNGDRQKFCNSRCSQDYWDQKRAEHRHAKHGKPYICECCGQIYKAGRNANRFYCSKACQRKARASAVETIVCPVCGKPFQAGVRAQRKYCSNACYGATLIKPPEDTWEFRSKKERADSRALVMRQLARGEDPTPGILAERTIRLERLRLEKFDEAIRLRLELACTDTEISRALQIAMHTVRSWLSREGLTKPDGVYSEEQYKRRLHFFARMPLAGRARKIFAICGFARLDTGLEGLVSILEYRLEENPYSGDTYVFCSKDRCRLKFFQWDGSSFQTGSRKIERGRYPWPGKHMANMLEITEEEFQILLAGTTAPRLEASKKR